MTSEAGPDGGSLRRLVLYFLHLGTTGFGGPIATVGYMQRDLVESRRWISASDFLNGVALSQTMPGPLAAQVCMWVGFLRARAFGALTVAVAFIAPSFALVIAITVLYQHFQASSAVGSIFYGVAPGVVAIIVLATIRLARLTNVSDPRLWSISVATAVITVVAGAEIAALVILAGVIILLWDAPPRWVAERFGALSLLPNVPIHKPLLFAAVGVASLGTLGALALFFLKSGAFSFGSGLAIVPFLREGVVNGHHWLTERQFFDAVAIGLITPGPVVITAAFIGYLVAGFPGAIVATIAIFLPVYLGIVVPGPWFVRHRDNAQVQGFVKGATAAAAGAIAGATVVLARQAVVDVTTAGIAVGALFVLWRLKNHEPLVVFVCAALGLALH